MSSNAQSHDVDALRNLRACVEEGSLVLAVDKTYAYLRDRKRWGYSQVLEDLVTEFLRLCVDSREHRKAKDVLWRFKVACLATNFDALLRVVNGFIKYAESRASKAEAEARQQHAGLTGATVEAEEDAADGSAGPTAVDGDTLDDAVEAQILHVVSGDVTRDRAERTILQPWARYLSDVFTVIIYVLRRTNQLERELHNDVFKRAFEFCRTYRRPADLRRFVSEIDGHWDKLEKKFQDNDAANFTMAQPDVQIAFLNTRFVQLETATALDLWGDVSRAVEAIHKILSMLARHPKQAGYTGKFYQRLASVFWTCRDTLFHAIAQVTYTSFLKARDGLGGDREAAFLQSCSQATLAALVVPFWLPQCVGSRGTHSVDHAASREREQTQRLTRLLGKTSVPTRASLQHDVEARGFLARSDAAVRRAFHAIEGEGVDALPLEAAIVAHEAMEELSDRGPELTQYRDALLEVASVRVLQHISSVYTRVKISWLLELLPHLKGSAEAAENIVTALTANNCIGFRARVHHDTGTIAFPPAALRSDAIIASAAFLAHGVADVAARLPPKAEERGLISRSLLALTPAKIADYQDQAEKREHHRFGYRRGRIKEQKKARADMLKQRESEQRRQEKELEQVRKQTEAERQQREAAQREAARAAEEEKAAEEVRRKLVVDEVAKAKGATARVKELEKKVKAGEIASTTQLESELKSVLIKQHEEEERRRADERLRLDCLVRRGFREEADQLTRWIRTRTEVSDEQVQEARQRARRQWEADVEMKSILDPIKVSIKDYKDAIAMRRVGGGVSGGVRR
eukprot:TRINITY_DN69951_c0_g1_i1.p1 TRINITY_DN69951_c0_g1~~TRINITY_DN69951_c0_g1_i1.p1  ORF type:complete len:804 (+),score=264.10 TRINITY_DN69951_c0_g1_i1:83-2494(+)